MIKEKIEIDESDATVSIRALAQEFRDLAKESAKAGKSSSEDMKKLETRSEALEKKLIDLVNAREKDTAAQKKQNEEIKKATSALKDMAGEVNIMGVNVGNAIGRLGEMKDKLGGVVSGLKGTGKSAKGAQIALAAIGGPVIIALTAIVALLTKTQKGLDFVAKAGTVLNTVLGTIVDRLAILGEGLVNLFTGNAAEGWDKMRESVAGLGEEIIKDATAAAKFKDELIKTRREIDNQTLAISKAKREAAELKKEAEAIGPTTAKGAELARQAQEKLEEAYSKSNELKRTELDLVTKLNDINNSTHQDLAEQRQLQIELDNEAAESAEKQTELIARQRAAREQYIAKLEQEKKALEQLQQAYFSLISGVDERLQSADLQRLSGTERLEAERQIALEEINILETKAKAAAEAAKIAYEAEEKFLQLRANVNEEFNRKVESQTFAPLETKTFKPIGVEIEPRVDDTAKLGASIKQAIDKTVASLEDETGINLPKLLGLDEEGFEQVLDFGSDFFGRLQDLWTDNISELISENDKLIDTIRRRQDAVNSSLEEELEKAKQGYANNVTAKRAELKALADEEKKALEKSEKLRKEKLTAQLISEGASQASSLATAAAKVFAAEAGKGLLGILFAGSAILTMFSLFKKAKANSRSATRKYKGGRLDGLRDSGLIGGETDIPGRGDGHRIEDTDVIVGGDEYLMNGKSTSRNLPFLDKMNKGEFDDVDLDEVLSAQPNFQAMVVDMESRQARIERKSEAIQQSAYQRAIVQGVKESFREGSDRIVEAIEKKKGMTVMPDGTIIEFSKGKVTYVKRIGNG